MDNTTVNLELILFFWCKLFERWHFWC